MFTILSSWRASNKTGRDDYPVCPQCPTWTLWLSVVPPMRCLYWSEADWCVESLLPFSVSPSFSRCCWRWRALDPHTMWWMEMFAAQSQSHKENLFCVVCFSSYFDVPAFNSYCVDFFKKLSYLL